MDEKQIMELKIQHQNNYKKAIMENIKNNTKVLVEEDLLSLIKKPPLDSMDIIKSRFLDLAKKNKIILNTENLSKIIEEYRKNLSNCLENIKKIRTEELISKVEKTTFVKDNDIIKINKKDFVNLNKEIRKIFKDKIKLYLEDSILKKIDIVFNDIIDDNVKIKFVGEISKFLTTTYQKQMLENIDIKILVKDTTLINGVKEQSERYLFTLHNSHLFN